MSEVLQNDEPIAVYDDSEVIEDQDTGAELATASDDQHEPIDQADEDSKKQQATQDIINKKTFEAKQAQRDLQAANDRLKTLESQEYARKAALVANIPPYPDQYDDDFERKLADRDAAILAQAEHNSTQAANQRQQEFEKQQQVQKRNEQIQKAAVAYDSRATALGISPDELRAAGGAVMQYGLSEDLTVHILSDPDGPLITKHLAANPHEGFELATMSPYAVGAYLDNVKARAGKLKPKLSSAPDPADTLRGNGVDPDLGKYPGLKGTVYT